VVSCDAAKVECSSITGESAPVAVTVTARSDRAVEAGNVLLSSCLVHQGSGLGIVIRTGDRSFIGSIARLATSTTSTQSTLTKELSRFVTFIAIFAVAMAVIFFIVGVARGQGALYTFVNGFLVIIIANVPQGTHNAFLHLLWLSVRRTDTHFFAPHKFLRPRIPFSPISSHTKRI